MTMLGLAVASLRHRRLRTIMTVLSVSIAVGILTVMLSVVQRISQTASKGNAPRTVVTSTVTGGTLPLAYESEISKIPGVTEAYHSRHFLADDGKRLRLPLWAVSDVWPDTTAAAEGLRAQFNASPDVAKVWHDDRQGMIISPAAKKHFGWKEGDLVTFHAMFGNVQGRVSGVATGYMMSGPAIFMHYEYIDELLPPSERGRVSTISTVSPNFSRSMEAIAQEIDRTYDSSNDPTLTMPLLQYIQALSEKQQAIPQLLIQIGILILIVTTIITISTLSMSLRERRAEFGALRALGYTRMRVFRLILTESISLCLLAGIIGSVLPYVLYLDNGLTVGGGTNTLALSNIHVSGATCLIGVVFAMLLGFLVALIPAFGVMRLNVINALQTN